MLKLNIDDCINHLHKHDFTSDQIGVVLDMYAHMMQAEVKCDHLIINGGDALYVELLTTKSELYKKGDGCKGPMLNGYFNVEVEGLDSNCINGITIPPLSIKDIDTLDLTIDYLPFFNNK
jgi:hypothetical protein